MELLNDFKSYEDCKEALIESYGNVDIAKIKLKRGRYSHIHEDVLEENLKAIKEGLGDKIINFFSKALGGGIAKLDKILADMKDEEINFIKSENEAESKFYKMTSALAHLKKIGATRDEQNVIHVKLSKLQKLIKDLISSHNSIMDDLEKQVNIITKESNRKSEYYNLKRAEDSVETKKMRAEFKKKLVSQDDEGDYLREVQKILGTPEDAQKDLEKAENKLAKEKERIGAGEEAKKSSENKDSSDSKKYEIVKISQGHNDEIEKILVDTADYVERGVEKLEKLERENRLNDGNFKTMEDFFVKRIEKAMDEVEETIAKLNKIQVESDDLIKDKQKRIKILLDIKKDIGEIDYYVYRKPLDIKDIVSQKESILSQIKDIESKKLPV